MRGNRLGAPWSRLRGSPALIAAVTSFAIAELLTGSTRPVMLVTSPVLFVLLFGLYGSGILTARELARQWDGGWPALLLLGAAYGVLEEGLVARSLFDPAWADLGGLAGHGRWAGVNWIWAVYLMIFHAVFSVAIPVTLAGAAVPERAAGAWLTRRGRILAGTGLLLLTGLGTAVINPRHGSPADLAAVCVVAGVLAALARAAASRRRRVIPDGQLAEPPVLPGPPEATAPSSGLLAASPLGAGRLAALGLAASAVLFCMGWLLPQLGVAGALVLALLAATAVAAALIARRLARRPPDVRGQLALAGGALGWLGLVDLVDAPTRPDTAAAVLAAAVALGICIRRRRRPRHPARGAPAA